MRLPRLAVTYDYGHDIAGMRIRIRSDPLIFGPPDPDLLIFGPPDPDLDGLHVTTDLIN